MIRVLRVTWYSSLCGRVCVFSSASSSELKNTPNANAGRNVADRNKNGDIFSSFSTPRLSYFFISLFSDEQALPGSSVLLKPCQEEGMKKGEKWEKGTEWSSDREKKEACWRCSIKPAVFAFVQAPRCSLISETHYTTLAPSILQKRKKKKTVLAFSLFSPIFSPFLYSFKQNMASFIISGPNADRLCRISQQWSLWLACYLVI